MPLYEYECDACGKRFEVIQKFSDPPAEVCRECGDGPVRRLLSSPAIQFKGTGWYITDYAQKGKSSGDGAAGAKDKTEKSDSKPAETTTAKSDSGSTAAPTKPAASDKS